MGHVGGEQRLQLRPAVIARRVEGMGDGSVVGFTAEEKARNEKVVNILFAFYPGERPVVDAVDVGH